MDTPQPQQPQPQSPTTPTHSSEACPKCGGPRKRQLFRTGSVQHPGRDVDVCTACGKVVE